MNIVIMAGGGGTRLWPISRQDNPKQFLDLGTGKTLLEHTYDRALTLADPADIYLATVNRYKARIQDLLPDVKDDHIFYEPARRDTGPAFAAACIQLKLTGKENEPTIFMWSDHVFTKEQAFLKDLQKIAPLIKKYPETIIIIGHKPTSPETTLGYLEVGQKVPGHHGVYQVIDFKEKPDLATAKKYLTAGNFFWNMAYISCRPKYLLSELATHNPELIKGIDGFEEALKHRNLKQADKIYSELPKISIDYALLEKTSPIITVTGDYGWNDIGGWAAVQEVFGQHGDHEPHGHHIHIDSKNNYVYNATDRTVSIIGLQNTIVVITEDAVLVTDRDKAYKVKEVVEKLEAAGDDQHL